MGPVVVSKGSGLTRMDQEWYFCLDHRTVEPLDGCRAAVRIGPFATPEEAAQALETVERRNREWDNDPDWAEE